MAHDHPPASMIIKAGKKGGALWNRKPAWPQDAEFRTQYVRYKTIITQGLASLTGLDPTTIVVYHPGWWAFGPFTSCAA